MITQAQPGDAEDILDLINDYAESGLMLPRVLEDVKKNLHQFRVYREDGQVRGVLALSYGAEGLVEIRSLAVHRDHARKGIASRLIEGGIDDAIHAGYSHVFVLTYAVPLFHRFGFEVIDKNGLPEKIWRDCKVCPKQERCDETAMIRPLVFAPVVEPVLAPIAEPAVMAEPVAGMEPAAA
ncbi:Amino-acid N-acetyltransferase [Nitrospina gracilis 3/211]|uniref:Amino-acid N-acetyltransferase n=1 Tax=Nitrospina gracilis (strain 3/211) TaxID=1266370 RepID=M1Z9P8_NITG3|nr:MULTISPECIES: GNAT family N-acetyltransferase [Nitrospina]MCF8722941.1 amino-acid N-acetyltransferase [Nitrospina sp. Nb-3]CCQ89907.1 Amino-acid N-acetyltransferase [Nitrospina gracilis 3/211]